MRCPSRALAILAVLLLASATAARAHDVVVEQVVGVTVRPQGDRLLVHLHVPVTALPGANLPHRPDGTLDTAALGGLLDVVAGDISRNLNPWQDESPLPAPAASASLTADLAAVEIDLTYTTGGAAGPFSARLNAFTGTRLAPVRTDVSYAPPSGPAQTMTIRGEAVRVSFDPASVGVIRDFMARALRNVLDGGDQLLFLACLLLPMRRLRYAGAAFAAMLAGQALAIAGSVLAPGVTSSALAPAALVGSSAVVIAALQPVVQARLRWVLALAAAFGVLNGLAFGGTLAGARQFAGSHAGLAILTFLAIVLAGEIWLAAIGRGVRVWVDGLGAPDRMLTFLAAALIVHAALHRIVDRAAALAAATGFGALEAMAWLSVGWAAVLVVVAASEALRQRTTGVPASAAGPAQA